MSGFLVDTNVWSETLRREPDKGVLQWLRNHERDLHVSVITIGEIKRGIDRLPDGKRRTAYQSWLTGLCDRMDGRVLSFNTSVAAVWGQMLARADAGGIRLPVIDSQIAATARRHALVVATRNEPDFRNAGVKTVNPFPPAG